MFKRKNNKKVYFDGAANTALDGAAFKAIKHLYKKKFVGNSSSEHDYGVEASSLLEKCRAQIINDLWLDSIEGEVVPIFTSGATESNNWVIRSFCERAFIEKKKVIIFRSPYEHSSITAIIDHMVKLYPGNVHEVILPSVTTSVGFKTEEKQQLEEFFDFAMKKYKATEGLVCVMAVNNETGEIYPLEEYGVLAHKHNCKFFVDGTQMIGSGMLPHFFRYGVSNKTGLIEPLKIDYLSFSGHKIGALEGVGCLIMRKDDNLLPLIYGGGQENGLRSGTTNVMGAVSLAAAIHHNISASTHSSSLSLVVHFLELHHHFEDGLLFDETLRKHFKINTNKFNRNFQTAHNIISLQFIDMKIPGLSFGDLLISLGVACSKGAACNVNAQEEISPVLLASGLTEEEIEHTARISFTRQTTFKDVDYLLRVLKKCVKIQEDLFREHKDDAPVINK